MFIFQKYNSNAGVVSASCSLDYNFVLLLMPPFGFCLTWPVYF